MSDVEVEGMVKKTLQHRVEEINQKMQEIQKNISYFERKYGMSTKEFFEKFLDGELGDDMDFFEWKAAKEVYDELEKEKKLLIMAIN